MARARRLGLTVPHVHRPPVPCGVALGDTVEAGVVDHDRRPRFGVAVNPTYRVREREGERGRGGGGEPEPETGSEPERVSETKSVREGLGSRGKGEV